MVKKKMITTRTANHAMPSTSRISAASPPKSDSKKNKNCLLYTSDAADEL